MDERTIEMGAAFRLPSRLVRTEAAVLRAALWELVRTGPLDLALDASGVSAVDGCGLQLLLACRNDLAKNGGSLTLLSCSRTLARALDLVGLTSALGAQPVEERP